MKLLINLCAQDGIISHNSGVGTIVKRYIKILDSILKEKNIDYHINLFTPEYEKDGFGYSDDTYKNNIAEEHTIIEVSNGSDAKKFFGNIDNWKTISNNVSNIINKIDYDNYDKVITILNDPTFNGVLYNTFNNKHIKVLIPHSTAKIYGNGTSDKDTNIRIDWEQKAFDYINDNKNSFLVATGNTIKEHFIKEYNCSKNKIIDVINGEILDEQTKYEENDRTKEIFKSINDNNDLILSFGRPEKYKNLIATMKLGKKMNKKTIVITQEYFDGMEIVKEYKKEAKINNTILYINEPFSLPQYILNNYNGKIILVVPSEKEIVGLIINEVRKLNKNNILIVANNILSFKDQIEDTYDGLLVDMNDLDNAITKINSIFNEENIKKININSQKRLKDSFNLKLNLYELINKVLGDINE